MPTNAFKRALADKRQQIGVWLTLESVIATEILAGAGFDWLLLDMEHSCIDPSQVVNHLRAAEAGTAELIVRIPSLDPVIVKRLVDGGARSIMFPFVQSAEDAAIAVSAMRYPPRGIRGYSGITRANAYSRRKDYLATYEDEQCVIVQVESRQALSRISEIAAVEGVDGIFIGPSDLSADMGFLGRAWAPEMRDIIAEAMRRIISTGKAAGTLNFTPGDAKTLLDDGFSFLAVGSDGSLLVRRSDELRAEFRS